MKTGCYGRKRSPYRSRPLPSCFCKKRITGSVISLFGMTQQEYSIDRFLLLSMG